MLWRKSSLLAECGGETSLAIGAAGGRGKRIVGKEAQRGESCLGGEGSGERERGTERGPADGEGREQRERKVKSEGRKI